MINKRILVLMFLLIFLPLVGCFPAPPNQAPIITSTPITTATVGVLYTYNVNATDPDDDALTYSLITKPSGMIINSVTGVIFWTPIATQVGNNSVIVKVSDGSLSINQSFIIKVSKPSPTPINHAPVIYSTPGDTATVGVVFAYDVNATDPDGDTLIYSLTTKPSGMFINSVNGLIWWVPTSVQVGNNLVTVMVSDGTLIDIQSFTITVSTVEPGLIGIKVSPKTMALLVGESGTITSVIAHYNDGSTTGIALGNCTYSSSVPGVATVIASEGYTINAIAKGTTTITVDYAGKSDTIVVTVSLVSPKTYTITATAGTGGSISPSGDVTVNEGSDKIFYIIPDAFYSIKDVEVDGESKGAISSYLFEDIDTDHIIEATFNFKGRVYNQDKSEWYETIQEAIDLASPDDTILVMAGVYDDVLDDGSIEEVLINKDGITLKSVEKHGAEIKGRISVEADNVTIEDFYIDSGTITGKPQIDLMTVAEVTIRGNKLEGGSEYFGVQCCTGPAGVYGLILIEDNEIIKGCIGLYLNHKSALVTIKNNIMTGPGDEGIWIIQNSNAFLTIEGNTVIGASGNDVKIGWEVLEDDRPISINGVTDETKMAQAIFDDNLGINSIFFPWMEDGIQSR